MSARLTVDYRETKTPKAVCVYTIGQESRYLIIENLSTTGKIEDFISYCSKQFGQVENYRYLDTHKNSDSLFDVILLKFDLISSSRYAKRKLDNKPYDYQLLRANYAPEYEDFQDIRAKFNDRLLSVTKRMDPNKKYKEKGNDLSKKKNRTLIIKDELINQQQDNSDNNNITIKKRKRI
jgi:hypothetical protein